MSGPFPSVPPAVLVAFLAIGADRLPRRLGHATAAAGALGVAAWILTVPSGAHLRVPLFGFDAVLFNVDAHARLVGSAFASIAAVVVAYLLATDGDRRQTALALAYVGAGLGAVFAGDWLSLVVYWELMAVSATVLIWHRTDAIRSGLRYAIYHEVGALALMAGVLLHFDRVGTFVYGDGIAPGLPALLVALGIGLNAGFLGLHVWIVDAYPRTHVGTSVVLAAVTTKVGAYAILRAFPAGHHALAYMGGAMVLFGVSFAILQTDMRRLLSYHIVSQVGYIVAGFGVGVSLAGAGATVHLVNNVLYKSLLFMIAGVLVHRTGVDSLKKLGGLGRSMPVTGVVFVLAAASIAGVPGFNGFISKGMIIDGVAKADLEPLWYVLIIGGVGTVISFAKFGSYAFLGTPSATYRDLTALERVTLGSVAALCLLLGVVPSLLLDAFPAASTDAAAPFAQKQFVKAGVVTAAGLVAFLVLRPRFDAITPLPDLETIYHPVGARLQRGGVRWAVELESSIDRIGAWGTAVADRRLAGPAPIRRARESVEMSTAGPIGLGILAIVTVLLLALALLLS